MTIQQEMRLLTKLLAERDFSVVTKAGITPSSFLDPGAREVFVFVSAHLTEHGELPSRSVVRGKFPEAGLPKLRAVEDSLAALCALVRESELTNQILGLHAYLKQSVVDPKAALVELQKKTTDLLSAFRPATGTDAALEAERVFDRYFATKSEDGVVGIPWPWPYMNESTRGMRFGQYIVLYAQGKSYKTWLLCFIAVVAHLAGYRVLFIEQEMPTEEIHDRIGALYGGIPWSSFYTGKLLPEEEESLLAGLTKLKDSEPGSFQIEHLRFTGAAAISELEGLVDRYKPDLVAFDGVYIPAGREWQAVGEINTGIKSLCLRRKIVTVGTAQENNDGRVSFKTFEQDADLLMRLTKDVDNARASEVVIEVPFSRQAAINPFKVHTLPARNFGQKEVLTEWGDSPGDELSDEEPRLDDGEQES